MLDDRSVWLLKPPLPVPLSEYLIQKPSLFWLLRDYRLWCEDHMERTAQGGSIESGVVRLGRQTLGWRN